MFSCARSTHHCRRIAKSDNRYGTMLLLGSRCRDVETEKSLKVSIEKEVAFIAKCKVNSG
ncbi:MAG: hypothetical protein WBF52_18085 [Geitlerinemataceae cyanobacterium]